MSNKFISRNGIINQGSINLPYTFATSNYYVSDDDYFVDCSGTFSVFLPDTNGLTGRQYVIKNTSIGLITLVPSGFQTIDGYSSITLSLFQSTEIIADGNNWLSLVPSSGSGTSGTSGVSGTSGINGSSGTSGSSGTGFNTVSNPGVTRILTSDGTPNGASADQNLTFDGNTLTLIGDLTVSGGFTVSGTSSVVNTTNLFVQDPIVVLAATQSGSPLLDSGIFINRGTGQTQSFFWDESADEFVFASTNDPSSIIGNVNISSYSNLRSNKVTATQGQFDYLNLTFATFSGGSVDYIDFTENNNPSQEKRLIWDANHGTVQIGLTGGNVFANLGLELYAQVFNGELTTLLKGEVVYISGAQGDKIKAKRASNIGDDTSSKTIGVVSETILSGEIGYVTTQGIVQNLNLGSFTTGDRVYLGSASGTFTKIRPQAPYHDVFIGVVIRANNGNGELYVRTQNGYELGELHDVFVSGTPSNGQTIAWNSVNNRFELSSLVGPTVSGSGVSGQSAYWVSPNVLGSRPSGYSFVGATVSGDPSTTQIAHTFSYDGNTFMKNDSLQWQITVNKLEGIVGTYGLTTSLYINTTPDLTGSPQLIYSRFTGPSMNYHNAIRNLWIDSGTQSWCYGEILFPPDDDWDISSTQWRSLSIDWTQNQYFIITSAGGDLNTIHISTKLIV